MTRQFGKAFLGYLEFLRLRTPDVYRARRAAALILALTPPLIFAWFAKDPEGWALFERSGSLTGAIGLLLASRRYLGYSALELLDMHNESESNPRTADLLEDIFAAKLGLGITAFGTIISGWGKYLGYWVFSYLVVWAVIAAYHSWCDYVRLRDALLSVRFAAESKNAAGPSR